MGSQNLHLRVGINLRRITQFRPLATTTALAITPGGPLVGSQRHPPALFACHRVSPALCGESPGGPQGQVRLHLPTLRIWLYKPKAHSSVLCTISHTHTHPHHLPLTCTASPTALVYSQSGSPAPHTRTCTQQSLGVRGGGTGEHSVGSGEAGSCRDCTFCPFLGTVRPGSPRGEVPLTVSGPPASCPEKAVWALPTSPAGLCLSPSSEAWRGLGPRPSGWERQQGCSLTTRRCGTPA